MVGIRRGAAGTADAGMGGIYDTAVSSIMPHTAIVAPGMGIPWAMVGSVATRVCGAYRPGWYCAITGNRDNRVVVIAVMAVMAVMAVIGYCVCATHTGHLQGRLSGHLAPFATSAV